MKTFRKYFNFENDSAEQTLGIQILNLGHYLHPANAIYPDVQHPDSHYFEWEKGRRLTEYQILYIAKGQGTFEASGLPPQVVEAGTVLLLYPTIWHRYKPTENTGWEEYWIGFKGSYAEFLLEQECFNQHKPVIDVGLNPEFIATFSKLIEIVEVKQQSHKKLESFILLQLLGIVYTATLISNQKNTRSEKIIEDIIKEINKNWQNGLNLEALAKQFNLSYVWFRKMFKAVTGTSPNQYILMLKLRKSEQMILETTLTLAEIAYQCGFESEFYFSRIFKQKMAINASDLRKKKRFENY